jgi:DNA-binding MarR family transcriptional regulator
LADEVYDTLLAQLMSLRIVPDSRVTIDALARELGVSQTPIRDALNRMEADGLVTRTRDPQNRRAHHVEFTAEGHAEFHSLLDAVKAFDESLRAGFTVDELATLRELLQRLAANAAAHPSRSRGQGRKEPR